MPIYACIKLYIYIQSPTTYMPSLLSVKINICTTLLLTIVINSKYVSHAFWWYRCVHIYIYIKCVCVRVRACDSLCTLSNTQNMYPHWQHTHTHTQTLDKVLFGLLKTITIIICEFMTVYFGSRLNYTFSQLHSVTSWWSNSHNIPFLFDSRIHRINRCTNIKQTYMHTQTSHTTFHN